MGLEFFIYFALCVMFFILGFFSYKNFYTSRFILIACAFPFINITIPFHTHWQLPCFMFFFIGGLFNLSVKNPVKKLKGSYNIFLYSILVFIYLIVSFPLYITHEYIDILKDLKFFIFPIIIVLYVNKYQRNIESIDTEILIRKVIKWNFYISTVFILSFYFLNLQIFLTDDAYFENNSLRYTNYGTFLLPFIFLLNVKLKKYEYLYILLPILYSGNRTLMILLIFILMVYSFRNLHLRKSKIYISTGVIIISLIVFSLPFIPEDLGLARFGDLLKDGYINTTILNRFLPFIKEYNSFIFEDYLVGRGIGYSFYIPWFEYRTNIDNYNIYLDNVYLTLFIKYGIMLFLPLVMFYHLSRFFIDKTIFSYFLIFFLLYGFTNSFLYQDYLFILLFVLVAIKISTKDVFLMVEKETSI